jgi:hypothetical protein
MLLNLLLSRYREKYGEEKVAITKQRRSAFDKLLCSTVRTRTRRAKYIGNENKQIMHYRNIAR